MGSRWSNQRRKLPDVCRSDSQAVTDQLGGNRVKHLAQREGAGAGDINVDLLVVGGPADRQLFQRQPLLIDALGVAGVAAANDLVDEAPPGGKIVEVGGGAQQQGVAERSFEMAVRALDRTVLVRHTGLLRVGVMRIASPEMLLNINLLPHLICSFWASGGIGGYEAGEYDDAGRRPSRTRGNDSCARGERPHAPLGNQARKAAP